MCLCMNTLRLAAVLALVAPLTACAALEGQDPGYELPATCNELFQYDNVRVDGLFVLHMRDSIRTPWLAYCATDDSKWNMTEYLPLPRSIEGMNEAGFVKPGGEPWITSYAMISIDPQTFRINPNDLRFATSQDGAKIPFATAIGEGRTAWAKIDLRGTGFVILPSEVAVTGNATATSSDHYQVLTLAASDGGTIVPRDGIIGLNYVGSALPADEAAAAEAGIELTEAPQP